MRERLIQWLTYVPENIAPEHRRAYHLALILAGVSGSSHFMVLLTFAMGGITILAIANIASVLLFVGIFFMIRHTGKTGLGMVLMSTEFIVHQVLVVYYIGWGYGFQYYLFPIAVMLFLGHFRSLIIPSLFAIIGVSTFGWLYHYGQYLNMPHIDTLAQWQPIIYWMNLYGTMLGLAGMSLVYTRAASRMEQELRDAQVMIVNSEKMAALGKLAAGLAHEINNPIGAILSGTQTGVRAVERLRKQAEQPTAAGGNSEKNARVLQALGLSLESTVDAAQRLSELVNRLQGFMRVDEAAVKKANLHEGIESTIALLQNQLQNNAIEAVCIFDDDFPEIICRPAEINQVFMHLLQNAIDAIEASGKITITTSHDSRNVFVAISDTGRGLSAEMCETLFDLSFSSGQSRVKLGMGLPISHQIITRHNGELRVESTLGEGSTFTIVLPREIYSPAEGK